MSHSMLAVPIAQPILWTALGHHALTCKRGGDVVTRHNKLWDLFVESCQKVCIGVQVEVGNGYGHHEHSKRPADVLAANLMLTCSLHFDFTVTSLLVPNSLPEASVTAGSAVFAIEEHKHRSNDSKRGWVSVPHAVEMYGCWGTQAKWTLSQLAPVWAQHKTARSP